ncbi:glycoside hydrolase family 18 protein [Aciduricibacillus chroicocephali]|uniref:Glycoside hydrolase family 18 protein n=1 Tax=Aciduricibacillus chroicocephali TaxID=3054939 RepID=A0ABY9KVT9_9BACI|nr:glycoside hydrolase family 18 protein [Bacillaceae bacterium 44XB]
MQIHVVKRNESLFNIANTYGTTPQAIIDANELDAPNQLVVGQALVIPIVGSFHFVQPGESLYTIARDNGTTAARLSEINRIPVNQPLQVGLRLYIPPRPKTNTRTVAYIEPQGNTVTPALQNAARKAVPNLTHLLPFSFRVNRDGTLIPPPLDDLKTIASNQGTTLTMGVANLVEGSFNGELAHIVFTVQAVQDKLLDEIVNTAKRLGFTGVDFDFEFLLPGDRELYNRFLRKARSRLKNEGLEISTTLVPKTSSSQKGGGSEAHDYAAHGQIADYSLLMTYEWGYVGGPPLAVSPINEVRRVVDYALSVMPANKILLGQNLYGYDWTLPYRPGGTLAKALSPQQAITLARETNSVIQYDTKSQAPYFNYTDNQGRRHEVWFEDARSIQAKFNLVKEKGLRGIGYWKLGLAFPQNWVLLGENFNIVKE